MSETFTAMMLDDVDGKPVPAFRQIGLKDLPDHEVLVEVSHSSLNYKDGLAVSGRGRIAKKLPIVCGVDLVGIVRESRSPLWSSGDRVVVNGHGLSETEWGGYSRFQRVKPEWLIRLPDAFDPVEAMAIGTAGYTAALCVDALESWGVMQHGEGEVVVTGASGGVGSTAVILLAAKGYEVVASTGRPETHSYLSQLGASSFIDRADLAAPGRPLQKERWSGAVDSVGSTTLVNVLAQTVRDGAVTACGLVGGADLPGTVYPHILRGVALLGVDSVFASAVRREKAWNTLAAHLDRSKLSAMTRLEPMRRLPDLADEILRGEIRGRVVIEIG